MSETKTTADGLEQLLNLEEKVNRTIDLLRSTKAEKEELARENTRLQRECEQKDKAIEKLEDHLGRLEQERDAVRGRLQRLLEQVDSLTSDGS
jgi:FtsZ-binding cell division protein ZapB